MKYQNILYYLPSPLGSFYYPYISSFYFLHISSFDILGISISEEKQILQEKEISNLGERVLSLEEDKLNLETSSSAEILASEKKASGALEQVGTLSN